jgi:hypothetical protein
MNDMALTFPPELLKRQAVIYVRQSTQSQVMTNLESQRRQYDLVEMARGSTGSPRGSITNGRKRTKP